MSDNNIIEEIINLYKQKDWRTIIRTYNNHPDRNKLLWVFPTEENFEFITNCMVELQCDRIVSIGCGSGLLEWMITEATGHPVSGIEVDGAWWHCKYAPPTFIPLLFTPQELDKDVITILQNSQSALLFCYFNNGPAFKSYLNNYSGEVIFIIGPGKGKIVYTDPKPFGDMPEDWELHASQEVGNSQDYIVVYKRINSFLKSTQ